VVLLSKTQPKQAANVNVHLDTQELTVRVLHHVLLPRSVRTAASQLVKMASVPVYAKVASREALVKVRFPVQLVQTVSNAKMVQQSLVQSSTTTAIVFVPRVIMELTAKSKASAYSHLITMDA